MLCQIDNDTGEIKELPKGSTVLTPKAKEEIAKKKNMIAVPKKGEGFVKIFQEALPQLSSCGLSTLESSAFFYLVSNLRYGSNAATYPSGKLITRENLCDDMGSNKTSIQKAVARLIGKGLIAETKIDIGKVFIVNPFVVTIGNRVDQTSYNLFKHTRWYRDWTKTGRK